MILFVRLSIGCAWRLGLDKFLLVTRLLKSIVEGVVVQLSQVFVDTKDFLMLNCSLHLGLRCIALLLLFDEFLNF